MKRTISILAALLLIFSLVGCNREPASPTDSKTTPPSGTTAGTVAPTGETKGDSKLIGFSMSALDSTMKLTLDNFERVAKEHGWEYVSLSADGDVGKELTNCENLISLGCDVVVIMVCDSDASASAIQRMTEAGVKVIIAGRSANVDESDYYCYVSGSQALGGTCQADYVNQWLQDHPEEELNIAIVRGLATSVPAQIKYDAFVEACVNNPANEGRVHLITEGYADAEAEKAYNLVTDWMQVYPEINCFISQADDMSSGIVNALRAQNLDPIDDFLIVSADGNAVGIAGLRSGEFDATVCLSLRSLGDSCGIAAERAFAGEDCEKTLNIEEYYRLMTLENMDQIVAEEGLE